MKLLYSPGYGSGLPEGFNRTDETLINKVGDLGATIIHQVSISSDGDETWDMELSICEIPNGWHYMVLDYDGNESIICSASPIVNAKYHK